MTLSWGVRPENFGTNIKTMPCVALFVVWGEVGEALGVAFPHEAGRTTCMAVVWSPLFPKTVIVKA